MKSSAEVVQEACEGFEPIKAYLLTSLEAEEVKIAALQSIAISLKRIADMLEED